jgi:TonB-linked SusC/RagA family outer membrane protein
MNNYLNGGRNNFPSNEYNVLSMGDASTQTNSGRYEEWALLSYFGRLNYNYKERYLLEATLRIDGSSRFPKNNRFASFPSVAAGWRVSEEPFFEPLVNTISYLKFKASYGVLGNQEIGFYPYQQTLASGNNQMYVFGTTTQPGAAPTIYVDPNLHWESTRTVDGGLEMSLLKGLVSLDANYFSRKTYDILVTPSAGISNVLGMNPSQMNIGNCTNKGIELEISHQKAFKNFNYKISGQLTVLDNKITYMGIGASPLPSGIIGSGGNYVGYPMQAFYGYRSDGVFLNTDEIANWPKQTVVMPKPQPGDIRYKDINGPDPSTNLPTGSPDGQITVADQTYLGSRIPKINYSGSIEMGYRGFDFKMIVQGLAKVSGILRDNAGWAFTNNGNLQRWQYDGSWTFNQSERYPAYPRLQIGSTGNYITSDYWIRDAAFLRIKHLQLGYTLPKNVVKSAKINNIRLYFSGDNLLSFNKYPKGWDPEQTNVNGESFYPIVSIYTFGLNINF